MAWKLRDAEDRVARIEQMRRFRTGQRAGPLEPGELFGYQFGKAVVIDVSGRITLGEGSSTIRDEVHALAQRMDAMPAGGSLSQNDIILILLVAILVLVAL